jgi:hypothetical protein
MINIAEIIKRFPEDFEYYNILTGICTVEILENDYIKILPGNIILNKYGQHSSFEASECILFPKKDQRDWEAYFIDSGYRINIFSRLAGLNISNRMFYYKDVGDCKIKLNLEKRNIEVYTSTPPYHIDTLDEFGFSSRRSIFLTPFKHSSYLDWVDVPEELLIGTLVVASNNKTFWSIGTYEGNQCVTTTFPKRISARYQYIVPYNLFNLETGEFPESEIMNVLKD